MRIGYLTTVLAVVAVCSGWLSGCSSSAPKASSQPLDIMDLVDGVDVRDKLYQQYDDWLGTRYQWGGQSRSGVDCSGFVQLTYTRVLGSWVPRTTLLQSQFGRAVNRVDLQPGDLVFFKTGFDTRHVGMYLQDGDFLHASTTAGVTISNLDEQYWQQHYWQSRRMP